MTMVRGIKCTDERDSECCPSMLWMHGAGQRTSTSVYSAWEQEPMPFRSSVDALWHLSFFPIHGRFFFHVKDCDNDVLDIARGEVIETLGCTALEHSLMSHLYRRSWPIGAMPRRYDVPSRTRFYIMSNPQISGCQMLKLWHFRRGTFELRKLLTK